MDYIEPACCFDSSVYRGIPDAEPCRDPIDVPGVIRELDGLYNAGREKDALALLEQWRDRARDRGDWRGELSMLSELLGYHRRDGDREKAMAAVNQALDLIRIHRMGATVSGATVLLNAATTLKCFGRAGDSLPIFEHAARVYGDNLDPTDYRFAGLYNNMGLSYEDVKDYPGPSSASCWPWASSPTAGTRRTSWPSPAAIWRSSMTGRTRRIPGSGSTWSGPGTI